MAMPEQGASGRRLRFAMNARNKGDGLELLQSLGDKTVAAVMFDPQYRGVLDKMKYGNEGKNRERDRAELPAMTDESISVMVDEIERVLRPSGHLFLWTDKFGLCEGRHKIYLRRALELQVVDLLHWYKINFGMGRRLRCTSEYLVVIQKRPILANNIWTDRRLADSCTEAADRSAHPHAKPAQITERLIKAVTKKGDLVVDPCAGSYVVLSACDRTGRRFLGCDLLG